MNSNASNTPSAFKRRRIFERLAKFAVTLFCLWLFGSGIVAFCLVHRIRPRSPQPPPRVDWAHLENVTLATSDGLAIGGWVSRAGDRRSVVLLLHGLGESRKAMLPQMQQLAEHGYASMAISLRAHGDSGGSVNDFGFHAKNDVIAAVQFLHQQFPGRPIVLAGNSLGSVSSIFAGAELGNAVQGYFLESPYRDLRTAVRNRTNLAPPPFNRAAYAGLRLWGSLLLPENLDDVRPIDQIEKIPGDIPLTLLAAQNDPVCKLYEVQALYGKVRPHAKLVVIESSRHGRLARSNPKEYFDALFELLERTNAHAASQQIAPPNRWIPDKIPPCP